MALGVTPRFLRQALASVTPLIRNGNIKKEGEKLAKSLDDKTQTSELIFNKFSVLPVISQVRFQSSGGSHPETRRKNETFFLCVRLNSHDDYILTFMQQRFVSPWSLLSGKVWPILDR